MQTCRACVVILSGLVFSCVALAAAPDTTTTDATLGYPASTAPYMAVYRWGAQNKIGGASGNIAYAKWLHRPTVWAEDFTPTQRWDGQIDGGGWQLREWSAWKKQGKASDPPRRLVLSIPLLPGPWDRSGIQQAVAGQDAAVAGKPVSLAAGAKGEYNAHFKTLAEHLVKYGLGDSILRLGWEFNGGWYTWRASKHPADFAGYWRQIVKTMRAVPGAEHLQFCFNPTVGWVGYDPEVMWPGDDYVDYVGLDVYDQSWLKDTYPLPKDATADDIDARRERAWQQWLLHANGGIEYWQKFADQHHKLFCIPEWGVVASKDEHCGGDNPAFIQHMYDYITDPAHHVYFHCYFDVAAPDGDHQLSPGLDGNYKSQFPKSAAKFHELFGK